jgi:nitrous oxide reductase accessory protein NosL
MRQFLLFFFSTLFLFSNELSQAELKKLEFKGKKIAQVFCTLDKMSKVSSSAEAIEEALRKSGACGGLDDKKLKAVAIYLANKNAISIKHIDVPKGAKCDVCGMFVYKYPKWAALMVVDGKNHYFDGVKDMMKFYFYDKDFPYDRGKISKVEVSDYYTLEALDATKAFYVIGSNVYGPMGDELIPFKTKQEAKSFLEDHKGEKIVKFQEITVEMVNK